MKLFFFLMLSLSLSICSVNAQDFMLIAEDAAPNSFMENGQVKGKAVQVVQAVLKEMEMAGTAIEIMPWARGYKMLETQKNIGLFPTSRTKK